MARLLYDSLASAWPLLLLLFTWAPRVRADPAAEDVLRLAAELPHSVKFEDPRNYYSFGDEFAHGFFAQVYHATPKGQPSVKLAIKKMRIDSVGRARIAANEVLIGMHVVASLPHTVAYRDTYVYHDHIWFVMDYIPGPTVEKVSPNQWTHDSFCAFITFVLDSVLNYHEMGVCHGDLKSKNLMIDSQKHALVIVDFGLSRFMPEKRETLSLASWRQKAGWPHIDSKQWLSHGRSCNDLERVLEVVEKIYDESNIDSDAVSKMVKLLRMAEKQKISLSRMLSDPVFDEWRSGRSIVLNSDSPKHTYYDGSNDYQDYYDDNDSPSNRDWTSTRLEKEIAAAQNEANRQKEAQARMSEMRQREREWGASHHGGRKENIKTGGSQFRAKQRSSSNDRRSRYVYDGVIEIY